MTFSELLQTKQIKKAQFLRDTGIGKTTLTYYLTGERDIEGANKETLYRMAGVLDITPSQLISCIKEEVENKHEIRGFEITESRSEPSQDLIELSQHIKQPEFNQRLIHQYLFDLRHHDRQGIYAYTQAALSYNSSRIEGNALTPDETAELFNTGALDPEDGSVYRAKDVEEMRGHFAMFNRCLLTIDQPLSQQLIKDFHFSLENNVFEFMANGGIPGQYKTRYNRVNDIQTIAPKDVPEAIEELLQQYEESEKDIITLAKFHAAYEKIHPFQDGNGRTGRMILFRECLYHGIDPFIIEDSRKREYYDVLHDAQVNDKHRGLISFFQQEQQIFLQKTIPYLLETNEYSQFYNNASDRLLKNEEEDIDHEDPDHDGPEL